MQSPSRHRPFGSLLILAAAVALPAAAEPELRRDTTGFYPIWEGTGHVEKGGDVSLGTTGAQVGIGDVAHAGVQPLRFIVRSPNGYLKFALPRWGGWTISAQVAAYRLLDGASRGLFSPMYSSRLDNPDFSATVVPVSLSASVEPFRWLEVHQTLTALGVAAPGHLRTTLTPGYSIVAEVNPRGRHGISFHATEVGLWAHDMTIAGGSYRYRNTWMELRLGYFYRFTKSGVQGTPLAAFGVLL